MEGFRGAGPWTATTVRFDSPNLSCMLICQPVRSASMCGSAARGRHTHGCGTGAEIPRSASAAGLPSCSTHEQDTPSHGAAAERRFTSRNYRLAVDVAMSACGSEDQVNAYLRYMEVCARDLV